ncbi:MAG: hypothetical protein IPK33_00855 [Gemmatimonadetes bacterium]|nr:hypothetical protein [Gemmatimonadota bacterium]
MSDRVPVPDESPPLMQRLFDNVFLLLALGVVVMFVVYTGWGCGRSCPCRKAHFP